MKSEFNNQSELLRLCRLWFTEIAYVVGYDSVEDCKRDVKNCLLGQQEYINKLTGTTETTEYKLSEMKEEEPIAFMHRTKNWAQAELGCYLPHFEDSKYKEFNQAS
jgi:hypothetical protein